MSPTKLAGPTDSYGRLLRVTGYPGHEIYLCEPDPDAPSCITTWDQAEYLSATGLSAAEARQRHYERRLSPQPPHGKG